MANLNDYLKQSSLDSDRDIIGSPKPTSYTFTNN